MAKTELNRYTGNWSHSIFDLSCPTQSGIVHLRNYVI